MSAVSTSNCCFFINHLPGPSSRPPSLHRSADVHQDRAAGEHIRRAGGCSYGPGGRPRTVHAAPTTSSGGGARDRLLDG